MAATIGGTVALVKDGLAQTKEKQQAADATKVHHRVGHKPEDTVARALGASAG